jgi:RNA polymerase sigma-70 factor (ECF subfamily)
MAADIEAQIVALLPRLRRFARSLAGTADAADDLVQGACEKALAGIDGYRPDTRLDSWMYRILHNLWIDQHRRARPTVSTDAIADLAGDDGRRTTESRLELARVRDLIQALPGDQKDVLVLVCLENFTYRETAGILDVPVGTVMSRLSRARAALAAGLTAGPEPRMQETAP